VGAESRTCTVEDFTKRANVEFLGRRMTVVVGGHSRKIGKTSVTAGLIAALPQAEWTAVKISANRNGAGRNDTFILTRERFPTGKCDSGRYLKAGAVRSYRLRAADSQLPAAIPTLRRIQRSSKNVILESNRVLEYLDPDLYIAVLDFTVEDFKESARRFLSRADAIILVGRGVNGWPWKDIPAAHLSVARVFRVQRPSFITPELVRFVRNAAIAATSADHMRGRDFYPGGQGYDEQQVSIGG